MAEQDPDDEMQDFLVDVAAQNAKASQKATQAILEKEEEFLRKGFEHWCQGAFDKPDMRTYSGGKGTRYKNLITNIAFMAYCEGRRF